MTVPPTGTTGPNPAAVRFLALALAGLLLYGLFLYLQAIPARIQHGLRAQEAIRLLDAQRAPLLRLQGARIAGITDTASLHQAVRRNLQAFRRASRYNAELSVIVGDFAARLEAWLDNPANPDDPAETLRFIDLLEALARAEAPIHADIQAGSQAEFQLWLGLALLGLWLILLFFLYQRQQRGRIAQAEKRLRAILDQSPFAIQIFAPDGTPLHMNQTAERLWGVRMADLAHYNLLQDRQLEALGITPCFRRAVAGEAVTTPVIRYDTDRTPQVEGPGRVVEIRSHIYPVKDEDGRVREIIIMHEDVSALEEAQRRLVEAQRVARLGSWELDLRTNHLYWSDEIFRIFEIDPQHFAASYESFLETVHPEDREAVNQAYLDSVANRTEYEIQHRLLMPDGRIKHVHERGRTDYAADGTPLRSIGTVLDITDYKRLEAELSRHRDHLEELVAQRTGELEAVNAELESFSYSVSHDLRAPLRAISGFSDALREDCGKQLDAAGREYLDRISANVQRMTQLIDDLLALSRTSQAPLQVESVDLGALADEVAEHMRQRYPGHAVYFVNRVHETVQGDPKLLRILLENLLDNAWKYTTPVEQPEVIFETETHDGETVFVVRDNGVGFDMAYADKLFGAFQRLHGREFPGTGIGLATVQRVVHRHRGRISGEGEPDRGARFRFTLNTVRTDPDRLS